MTLEASDIFRAVAIGIGASLIMDLWNLFLTVVFPFFLMQPSLGLGIAASRTPNPTQARVKSLATHTVFGLGMYGCALGMSYLFRLIA